MLVCWLVGWRVGWLVRVSRVPFRSLSSCYLVVCCDLLAIGVAMFDDSSLRGVFVFVVIFCVF